MPSGSRGNFLSAVLGAGVVAAVFAVLALSGTFDDDGESAVTVASTADQDVPAPAATRTVTDVSALYNKVRDGVVYVQTSSRTAGTGTEGESGSGSGFVLDTRGYILTNDHVVAGADTVRVRIGDSEDLISAKVAGTDASSDLAVLKVDPAGVEGGLKPLALGSSGSVQVGQPAVAIGSPFGLQGSLTTGVISALGRPIQSPNGFQISGALQTDAAINPGNSGGPLLDMQGNVIGVNSAIARVPGTSDSQSGNIGVGFSIPSDQVKKTAEQLIRTGKAEHPVIGVILDRQYTGGDGVKILAEATEGREPVTKDGPAGKAGVQAGDLIVEFEGRRVTDPDDLVVAIRSRSVGEEVSMKVRRGGREISVKMTLQGSTGE